MNKIKTYIVATIGGTGITGLIMLAIQWGSIVTVGL